MHKTATETFSSTKHTFSIIGNHTIDIEVTHNPFHLPLNSLFLMAARVNTKRSFLFVSKVLGKHIPVKPAVSMLGGAALAACLLQKVYNITFPTLTKRIVDGLIDEDKADIALEFLMENPMIIPEKVKIIGFAETATALGHSVFAAFLENVEYIHTTRELLVDKTSIINFEEEHSHATSHRFYSLNEDFLIGQEPILLVDDEITTGKTTLNIIRDIQRSFPRKHYVVMSLLDWRSEEDKRKFGDLEEELGITITPISLIRGKALVHNQPNLQNREINLTKLSNTGNRIHKIYLPHSQFNYASYRSVDSIGDVNENPYLLETGRFGISPIEQARFMSKAKEVGRFLNTYRKAESQTLVLGSGEFMYVPMAIAHYMGGNVRFHSTTRSPIYPNAQAGYGAQNAFQFRNPEDPGVINFFYNLPYGGYDDLFLFLERDVSEKRLQTLTQVLANLGVKSVYLVICSYSNSNCS
ncbi:phosphoribosyltransferase family protein [Brevibacillus nitrificans]|uniref:phosphoribosyltransferase family protein n=1 Tax=Brevibacillus nitrificans TaxID=651560 RepID=UPI002861E937|nr:phosphoribosyltransferase family protein [Brevibacillus nitrificans]MDR7318024.1 adenine/guanine phosphoribosyltransferase-like PRPP-binding protein [Brevibacillus nitrificans]